MPEEKKCGGIYRRQFLRLAGTMTAGTAMAGFAARSARADDFPKSTKQQAGYQDNASSDTCAECTLFQPPTDCQVVQGPVSAKGTCNYFTS